MMMMMIDASLSSYHEKAMVRSPSDESRTHLGADHFPSSPIDV